MTSIQPFAIHVSQEKIDLIEKKLALTTLPDEIEGAGWAYGAPLPDIRRLVNYWQNGFSWREQESKLNAAMPQYTTKIEVDGFDALEIHFVHQKSDISNAIPLLFVHGWPGHFMEVMKILPDLVKGSKDFPAFHVVAPSLPNYGFSEGVKRKGFGPRQYAEVCHKLMQKLSYPTYVTQGGDWGSVITRVMALLYPSSCKANHLNMATPTPPTFNSHPFLALRSSFRLSPSEQAGIARQKWFAKDGNGYYKTQMTKPQTIGYSQADSPVGLLAWIYEKLHDWTDEYQWTDDEVLTWVSIYIFSRAGAHAPSRTYYETAKDKERLSRRINGYVNVPFGVARFPKELSAPPKAWYGTMGPIVFLSEYERGGHFAAWERPDAILSDLRTMFGKKGNAYGVVSGKHGYDTEFSSKL